MTKRSKKATSATMVQKNALWPRRTRRNAGHDAPRGQRQARLRVGNDREETDARAAVEDPKDIEKPRANSERRILLLVATKGSKYRWRMSSVLMDANDASLATEGIDRLLARRGRRGGRAVRGRGRMRKRGLSGGGTLRRKSPQQGQRPSSAMGPVASARSQWPRASHNGLMHCTVKPGRYCMRTPSVASQLCGARYGVCGRSSLGRPKQNCWRGFCR